MQVILLKAEPEEIKQQIINAYIERFNEIKKGTKKELFVKDIHEHLICNSFFDLGFGVYYLQSFRKYKNALFIRDEEERGILKRYLEEMTKEERHKEIDEIYKIVKKECK